MLTIGMDQWSPTSSLKSCWLPASARAGVIFELEPEIERPPPEGQALVRHGFRWRTLRTVSIGLKPVVLKVKVPRWRTATTGEEFEQSPPPFPQAYTKVTRALARLIVDAARCMTLSDVASWLDRKRPAVDLVGAASIFA